MLRKTLLVLCAIAIAGCSAKHTSLNMMPVPEPGTREALLPTYKPTGSACLDSISANLLYSGCSELGVATSEDGAILMGCLQPQPGAQDVFSRGTFIHATDPTQIPPDAQPFCGDPTGVYAVWAVSFAQLISDNE